VSSKIDYHHCYQKRENSTTTTYNGSTAAEVVLCVCSTSAVAHNFVFTDEGRVTKNAVAPSDSNKRRVAVTARMVLLFIDGVGDGSDSFFLTFYFLLSNYCNCNATGETQQQLLLNLVRHDVLPSMGSYLWCQK